MLLVCGDIGSWWTIMYTNILIPTDGSEHAKQAAAHGVDLAEKYDATVHMVYVIEYLPTELTVHEYDKITMNDLEQSGADITGELTAHAMERGVDAVDETLHGTPYREILDYANTHDIDLLVLGTHGRTGVKRLLLGNVAEKIVRLADVPVLTVRKTEREKPEQP
jgi:nucleotide-binding universal stress UspA family protein